MKRALLRVICSFLLLKATGALAIDIYISPAGNDNNPGTIARPLASLKGARDRIRSLRKAKNIN